MEIDQPALRAAIASGERLGGLGVSAEWRLTEAELVSLSHFSVVCRLTVPESDAAYKRNYDMCQASPQIASGAGASIRLARGFCLSKASLKPNSVAGIGEWTGAYLAGEDVLEAFRQAGLTGLALSLFFRPAPGPLFRMFGSSLQKLSCLPLSPVRCPIFHQGIAACSATSPGNSSISRTFRTRRSLGRVSAMVGRCGLSVPVRAICFFRRVCLAGRSGQFWSPTRLSMSAISL